MSLVALATAGMLVADAGVVSTPSTLVFRSPSRDTVRKIVGENSHTHLYDMESYYGTFFIVPQYDQSFRSHRIAECLFGQALVGGNDCDDSAIVVSGTGADVTRGEFDLMAENFYLPRDFKSTLTFSPSVKTFVLDFQFYMALDEWCEGLYFRIYGPFVHTRWNLDFEETVVTPGTEGYAAGYFDVAEVDAGTLLQTFQAYGAGAAPTIDGLTINGLKFAKITPDAHTDNYFGELRFELGYNFLLNEDYHLGLNLQFAAPTGHHVDPTYLFNPVDGNGKSWELGGGVTGHYTFWRSEDEAQRFDGWLEADITHLFGAKQRRTLDLVGKPLSRYMLAAKFSSDAVAITGEDSGDAPVAVFDYEYSPVANFSTREVKVSAGVQADISLMFTYTCKGFSWDLGYNLWVRSCEDVDLRDEDCAPFPENTWALKGDAAMFGYGTQGTTLITPNLDEPVALSASQSEATIFAGTNLGTDEPLTNENINNPEFALWDDAVTPTPNPNDQLVTSAFDDTLTAGNATFQVNTSIQPVFIKLADLDLCGAETKGLSNKLFTHLNYTWVDCEDWIPYIGLGAEVEFGSNGSNGDCGSNNNGCSSDGCHRCSLSQWGVWVKAGLSFN